MSSMADSCCGPSCVSTVQCSGGWTSKDTRSSILKTLTLTSIIDTMIKVTLGGAASFGLHSHAQILHKHMATRKLLSPGLCRILGSSIVRIHSNAALCAVQPRRKPFEDVEVDKFAGTPFNRNYNNRNPRSGEILAIAPKPKGYGTRYWRMDYWHKYVLKQKRL